MNRDDARDMETRALRDRLTRLSEASLRINESLDLDAVLQGVLDSARSLTGASYGALVLLDDSGQVEDFLSSGLTAEESQGMWDLADGMRFFELLTATEGPLRLRDMLGLHHVPGPSRPPPARRGGSHAVVAGGTGPSRGKAGRSHLRRGEGSGRGVQPRRRGDLGHVRLTGGVGHRQRPAAPG